MKSTIEKALQRQREAEAAKKAEVSSTESAGDVNDVNAKVASSETQTSLERAAEKNSKTPSQKSSSEDRAQEKNIEKTVTADDADGKQDEDKVVRDSVRIGNDDPSKHMEIDLERLENLGFVTLTNARRQINEEYREIKRKLIQTAFGPLSKTLSNSNIIMVSSARPSEGKTFTAVNLALSIAAEQDKTVLLVDADVLKPNVLKTLGLESKQGLMDYLLGEKENISNVIYRTNVPKLRIIPAGSSHHLSTELLASGIMSETVNEFSTRYKDRVVIIDTPPIIGINESAILASFAGQALIVVEEGKSKLHDIQQSVERLNPDMAIGFVVNKSIATSETGGYYGYSYYGSDREDE